MIKRIKELLHMHLPQGVYYRTKCIVCWLYYLPMSKKNIWEMEHQKHMTWIPGEPGYCAPYCNKLREEATT